jgi:hypothetical protein
MRGKNNLSFYIFFVTYLNHVAWKFNDLTRFFIKTFGVIIEFVSEKNSKKFHNNVKSNQKRRRGYA